MRLKNILPIAIFIGALSWFAFLLATREVEASSGAIEAIYGTPTPEPRYSEKQQNHMLTQHQIMLNAVVGYLSEMQERKALPLPLSVEKQNKESKGKKDVTKKEGK